MLMRPKRVYDGQDIIFDAKWLFDKRRQKDKVLLKMDANLRSFETPSGARFWGQHPYQWVSREDADYCLSLSHPKFVHATIEEVEDYYADW
jgi:hypothetical protein